MKKSSESSIKDILGSRKLNELHTIRYASTDKLKQYLNNGLALRSQVFKKLVVSFAQFIKQKFSSIQQAQQIKKNITELESLSDDALDDIGIKREDIKFIVLNAYENEVKIDEKTEDSIVHFADFNKEQNRVTGLNVELKKCC